MNAKRLLKLNPSQARLLRSLWLALPVVIVIDCVVSTSLAVSYRSDTAAFLRFLALGSRVHVLALWFVLLPLLLWTTIFWWQHRNSVLS